MEITSETLQRFHEDFSKAVQSLEEKYDCSISLGRITYSDTSFSAKLTVNSSRDSERIAENRFDQDVWKFSDSGLQPGMYRRIVVGKDDVEYVVVGFVPNARKFPIRLCRIDDGSIVHGGKHFIKTIKNEYYAGIIENL
ncbi:MAG: hypothetical protein IJ246_07240 [Clostridia bacterium]|nr:hypothetical protein [Clostridia bacterium]